MNNKRSLFISTKDGTETKIEYLGIMKLLDLLIDKLKEENEKLRLQLKISSKKTDDID